MLTQAHIASSYLLSQAPALIGKPLTSPEVIIIIVAGNILDIDFVIGSFLGKKGDDHHNFITHTPIFVLIVWAISFVLFFQYLSQLTWILTLISVFLHLFLDDIGYWFCKLGWQQISKYPQINWFYPITSFKIRNYEYSINPLIKNYFSKAPANAILELVLILFSLLVFFVRY